MGATEIMSEIPFIAKLKSRVRRMQRAILRRRYKKLFDDVAEIFFRHDPIGINFEHNTDEYEPEVGTVLPRLRRCSSAADVQHVLHEEFVRWFSPADAGPIERYEAPALEIWDLLRHRSTKNNNGA